MSVAKSISEFISSVTSVFPLQTTMAVRSVCARGVWNKFATIRTQMIIEPKQRMRCLRHFVCFQALARME